MAAIADLVAITIILDHWVGLLPFLRSFFFSLYFSLFFSLFASNTTLFSAKLSMNYHKSIYYCMVDESFVFELKLCLQIGQPQSDTWRQMKCWPPAIGRTLTCILTQPHIHNCFVGNLKQKSENTQKTKRIRKRYLNH